MLEIGLERYTVSGERPIPAGTHQLRLEFDHDGGGIGKGGTVSLFVDGDKNGQGSVERTCGVIFSTDETVNVGLDTGTTVTDDYPPSGQNGFTGRIKWIQLDADEAADDLDHYLDPAERFRIIMGRHQALGGAPYVGLVGRRGIAVGTEAGERPPDGGVTSPFKRVTRF